MNPYQRGETFKNRGQVVNKGGDGFPATYDGQVRVLVETGEATGVWEETEVSINKNVFGIEDDTSGGGGPGGPDNDNDFTGSNIKGFTVMGDDDLRVISYIHTYQIPGLR